MPTGERVSNFKDRFNELFSESGKTNTDLGKELHVSNQTISAWRLGIRSPKEPTVIAIADYFKVNVEWLLGFDVQKRVHNPRAIYVPDSELFRKLILAMSPLDYEVMMDILERTNQKLRDLGEL